MTGIALHMLWPTLLYLFLCDHFDFFHKFGAVERHPCQPDLGNIARASDVWSRDAIDEHQVGTETGDDAPIVFESPNSRWGGSRGLQRLIGRKA